MTAQPSTHRVKAFDDDLEQLRATGRRPPGRCPIESEAHAHG